jgi:maltose O-acetyltransferase
MYWIVRKLLLKFYYGLRGKKYSVPNGCISSGIGENLIIEDGVSFGGNVFLFSTAPIIIGEQTMIAYGVIIHTSTHDYNFHPMRRYRIDRPVSIGKHVWIGAGAIILPGVKIDDYAIVGAGSVVTAHVPEGAIVVGNPARIVKYRGKEVYENTGDVSKVQAEIIEQTYLDDNNLCKNKHAVNY